MFGGPSPEAGPPQRSRIYQLGASGGAVTRNRCPPTAELNWPYNGIRTICTVRKNELAHRLDVRLDSEHRRRLEELAREQEAAISDVVRSLIDGAYEDVLRDRRRDALEKLVGLNVEDPPDPQTLARELEAAHEPDGIH